MFKNMFKRSWLSVRRKPSRSLVLMLVLFVMANLVLAGVTIKSATNSSMEFAKSSLGGEVSLGPDMEKMRESMTEDQDQSASEAVKSFTRPGVSKTTADEIAESDYVKDYTYSLTSFANLTDDQEAVESSSSNSPMGGGGMMMQSGGGDSSSSLTGDVNIQGINSYAYISEVKNNEMEISSGEYFDESTENGIMVSYDFADQNSLEVGDKIKLINTSTEKEIELSIVGIYDVTSDNHNANTIYMNTDAAAKFLDDDSYNDGDYDVSSVVYYMNNAENAEAFVSEMNSKYPELEENNLTLAVDDQAYQQMVGPIEQVGSFADLILWIVIIASVLVIGLIVILNVKDRRYEIGVLLSLGASKLNVAGQILTELLIIGTIGFAISIATSGFLAQSLGQNLLQSQLETSQTQSEQNFGRPGTSSTGGGEMTRGGGMGGPQSQTSSSSSEAISEIDVKATVTDYLSVFGIGYAIILLSVTAGVVNIFRLKPKTILSGKE